MNCYERFGKINIHKLAISKGSAAYYGDITEIGIIVKVYNRVMGVNLKFKDCDITVGKNRVGNITVGFDTADTEIVSLDAVVPVLIKIDGKYF